MLKKGYILRDPDLVPIARSLWIGSNATAVGWCGKPCLNVWNIKAFVSFHVSCFSQLKVYSTPQGLQNKRYKIKDSIVPFSFQYKYIWLILYNNFQSMLILSFYFLSMYRLNKNYECQTTLFFFFCDTYWNIPIKFLWTRH